MEEASAETIQCGKDARRYFIFDKEYRNINHGSFGTYPSPIRDVLRRYQDQAEARPDHFVRYAYTKLLDESRAAVAKVLNAPTTTCVFVSNTTIAINTVMRNLVFEPGDIIIYFATIYGANEKTINYVTETTPAEAKKIAYTYPVSDDYLCTAFEHAISEIKAAGKNPRIAIFDTVASLPGVRMPFERLAALCKKHNVLSCVDGAHGIGHIHLDLGKLDPDFFVSNCYKWLFVPRGCAVFYVPERNQHLMRSTIPTGNGFAPRPTEGLTINNPVPPTGKSEYITNFEFVGSMDNSPYCCVPAAIEWRKKVTADGKQGEEAIMAYTHRQAREAGKIVAGILGSTILENTEGTLGNCNLSNVKLPLDYYRIAGGENAQAVNIGLWMAETIVTEYDTFMAIFFYDDAWWVRLSAQIYLTIEDFEWAGKVLKEMCQRVENGEWKGYGAKALRASNGKRAKL